MQKLKKLGSFLKVSIVGDERYKVEVRVQKAELRKTEDLKKRTKCFALRIIKLYILFQREWKYK